MGPVNRLEKKNLIKVHRENKSVIGFLDVQNLNDLLIADRRTFASKMNTYMGFMPNESKSEESISQNSTLRFSLVKSDTKGNNNRPDYGGTFTLKQEIILQEGVKYLYGGWIKDDGSIGLSFEPYDEYWAKRANQRGFDEESDDIQGQILNLGNDDLTPLPPFPPFSPF